MADIEFNVTNYKGVRTISLKPSGRLIVIAGKNGAGKSSLIDGITELFDPHGVKLTPRPIRDGADEARAEYIDEALDIRIVRTWKKNGEAGRLEVTALDGAKYQRPTEVVAALTGGALFDPEAFLRLPDREQRDHLLGLVDLPFDLDELSRRRAGVFDKRRDAKRDLDRANAALAGIPKPAKDAPTEEISLADLMSSFRTAQELHATAAAAEAAEVALAREVDELTTALEAAMAALEVVQEKSKALPELPDLADLAEQLDAVEATNDIVRAVHAYEVGAAAVQERGAAVKEAQSSLDDIDEMKARALAEAAFPVAGLGIDDDGVTFEGIPFKQVNSARRRAIAFDLATAGSPDLRLVVIKDGDLLDDDTVDLIRGIAEERDYWVLMERDRDESRKIGFEIVDGSLVDGAGTPDVLA